MLIPPRYTLTSKISTLLSTIEACKEIIDQVPIPPEVEQNIKRQSTLHSSLFSARIEGNTLTTEDIHHTPSHVQKKAEVLNILKALNWAESRSAKDIKESDILTLHKISMQGLIDPDNLGRFRKNMEAIFNSAGIAIYMPPPPKQMHSLIVKLIKFINSDKESLVPIRAVLAHYSFEKIHPFLDGSGRVGRLLIQKVLMQGGYGMKGLLSLEEYLDGHRSEYYRMLEEPEKDLTEYVTFMLESIAHSAQKAKKMVLTKKNFEKEDYLLPRRGEIVKLIREHKLLNFDQIHRRFKNINPRTLRYDLKKLQTEGFVTKLGTTRGAYYKIFKNPTS
jgi:Fic family protein